MNRMIGNVTAPALAEAMRIVFVGHVDHGKSTLIGRLLHDTGSLPACRVDALEAMAKRREMPLEWGFLLDAFQAERDQALTIDTTQIRFRTERRSYVIIDAPGHREFLKNAVTGAASADAAVLVIDAREGVHEQTRRHAYLLHLMGIRQLVVIINKMDLVGCAQSRFAEVERQAARYLGELGIVPSFFIPTVARDGANVARRDERLAWYEGPTMVEVLDLFQPPAAAGDLPLRLPVQDVYKFDGRRIVVGRLESGVLRVGDRLLFSPSNTTAHVASIEAWPEGNGPVEAHAGDAVGFTLDEPVFVERGEVASHADSPPFLSEVFRARLFWFGRRPLEAGSQYKLKLATTEGPVAIQSVDRVIDTGDLSALATERVERHGVAEVTLRARRVLALDEFERIPRMGRFVLVEDYDIVGGGIVGTEGYPDQRALLTIHSTNVTPVAHRVLRPERERVVGHCSGVLWFTGLSGAGKSTLALALEQALFNKGHQVYVLDGDNIRSGLNANLGFSPEDRVENIRRVAEVAALFADAGFIVITAFISPYRADRERARRVAGNGFHEVYVKADLAVCEHRDPKGLYRRARRGEIAQFTGVSAPYEAPQAPELVLETDRRSIQECLVQLTDYVERNFRPLR